MSSERPKILATEAPKDSQIYLLFATVRVRVRIRVGVRVRVSAKVRGRGYALRKYGQIPNLTLTLTLP